MEAKVKEIMSAVLEIEPDEIVDDTSPATVGSWDSLNHINLVVSLEEEFKVKFEPEQIETMQSYALVVYILNELGVLKS